MLVVRPAGPDDYDALMKLAVASGPGFTSLPEHEPTLRERLTLSRDSFDGSAPRDRQRFTLMLEETDTGEVLGVAAAAVAVGVSRPFVSFRMMTFAQTSPSLGIRHDHRALVMVNECAGWSEVGSLFLRPEHRKGGAGTLLARSRYLMIAAAPQRFAETVLAELRGFFDANDRSPFYDEIMCKFFRRPFKEVDDLIGSTDGQFIFDLAPRHPIYIELLPERSRELIGAVHPQGEAARALLEKEGFRECGLVDVFDAGPTVTCRRDDIRTVRDSRRRPVRIGDPAGGSAGLIAVDDLAAFRATRAAFLEEDGAVILDPSVADALRVGEGDGVRVI